MNTPIRTYKAVVRAAVVASATALAALGLAGPASADSTTVFDSPVGVGGCPGAPPEPCGKPLELPFTTTQPTVDITFKRVPNTGCPFFRVHGYIDGPVGTIPWPEPDPNWSSVAAEMQLAPGNHTLNLDATCPSGAFSTWGGHLSITDFTKTGAPAAPAPAATTPAATVTGDVDVYESVDPQTGGVNKLGILFSNNQTQQVQVVGPCKKDDWCRVSGTAVPSGSGMVWGHLSGAGVS
jgi:hypothetical protein